MRTYGRDASGNWVQITEYGYVWLATLAQTLRLSTSESPFYANYGIPARQSVLTQIAPDAAIAKTQSQFSKHFAALSISKSQGSATPVYNIRATFLNGTTITTDLAT